MSQNYQKQALNSIKNQIGDQPLDQVYVIELDGIPFEEITPAMKALLETCTALQMLTINNCNLTSLKNFPHCPALIRLDLISNKLKGVDLNYLSNIRYIQTLYLSQNEFSSIDDFSKITHMRKLLQINLIGNDVCDIEDYEKKMFAMFPNLQILDGNDRNKQNSSQKNLLQESVNRINKNLFENSKPLPSAFSAVPIKSAPIKSLFPQPIPISPIISYKSINQPKPKKNEVIKTKSKGKIGKIGKSTTPQLKKSNAGLIFPKGRVTRQLRQRLPHYRISPKSGVFLTGCMEYLCLELLEIAGEQAKNSKKKRIMPSHIIQALKNDQEFSLVLKNVTVAGNPFI